MTANMAATRLRLSNPFRRTRGEGLSESLPHSQAPKDAQYEEEEEAHAAAVREANEWLQEAIQLSDRWTDHLSQIRLECPYTLPELRQLGRLSRAEGVPKCQALVRVPVIYDEIGLFIWMTLAEMDSSPALSSEAEDYDRLAAETRLKRSEAFLATLDQRVRFDRPVSGSSPAREGEGDRKRGDSPPVSPRGTTRRSFSSSPPLLKWRALDNKQQDYSFCRQENIEEVSEETNGDSDDDVRVRGRVLSRNSIHQIDFQESEANFFHVGRRSTSSAPSSIRSGSFGEKVGSIVGNLSKTLVTALGEGSPHEQSRRFILPKRARMKSS